MPTYCYTVFGPTIYDIHDTFERIFKAGEAPDTITVKKNGYSIKAVRDRRAEAVGMTTCVKGSENPTRYRSTWPMEPCIGSGVHPNQAQELRDHLEVRGCPTEINGEGNPVYTSAAHRRKALKIRGMHDRNSFS